MGALSGDVADTRSAKARSTREGTHENHKPRTFRSRPFNSECFGTTPRWTGQAGSAGTRRLAADFVPPRH